jgi:hypothetical protein
MEHQLDAAITVLLISKISSTCFWQTFVYLQERKTEIFTTYGIICTTLVKVAESLLCSTYLHLRSIQIYVLDQQMQNGKI